MSSVKTKCRPSQLALSSGPGDCNGNSVACLGTSSLDSLRSLSDGDSSSAPDVDIECCLIEGSPSPANHHTDHLRNVPLNSTFTTNTPINGNLKRGSPPENSSLDLITFPENSTCAVLSPAVTVPGEGDMLEPVQTSVSSCVNTSLDNWNGNITLVITSLQGHHGENQSDWRSTTSSGDMSVAASPELASPELASPEGEESSSSVSLRGSSENNCSNGSGEMVMRWNSFCLEEADTLTVSLSLVELSTSSSAHGSPALPADLGHGLLSMSTTTTLPYVCDGLLENRPTDTLKVKDNPGPQCWGTTFIQSDDQDLPPEGGCLAPPRSPVDVDPCEAEGVHQATFLCEPTPSAACGGASPAPSRRASSDTYFSGGSTEGRTFMLPASEELDLDGRAQTSTPVQCAGNKPLDLPSLTESPCTGERSHTGSPVVQTAIDQRGAAPRLASPKHRLVARLPPSANRISKAEIKKFPKPDFSRVRPKIMSRPAHPLILGSPGPAKNKPVNQPCRKPSQVNRNTPMRNTPSKLATVEDGRPRAAGAENAMPDFLGMTFIQADDQDLSLAAGSHIGPLALSLTEEAECRASLCDSVSAAFDNVPPVPSSQATSRVSSEAEHVASNCGGGPAPVLPGNQTCFPSPTESPSTEQRADPAPALDSTGKAGNKEEVPQRKRPGSVSSASSPSNQAPVSARRSRCWSESSSTTSTPHRESRASPSGSASFIIPKAYVHLGQSQARPASHNRTGSAHNKPPETRKEAEEQSSKEMKKTCLVTASSKTAVGATAAVGAACDRIKSRFGARPSLNRARGAPASAPQALPPVSRQRQGRDVCSSASGGMCSPRAKQSTTAGHQRSQTTEGLPVGTSSANGSTKPPVTGSRLPQASGHTLAVGSSQPSTAASSSRLPYKSQGVSKSIPSKASVHNEHSGSTGNAQVSAGVAQVSVGRPASCKTTVLKARLLSHPGSNIGPAGCKTTESTSRLPSRSRACPMKRTASSRLLRPAAVLPVDKNRQRATPRSQPQPQQQSPAPLPPQRDGHPDLVLAEGRAGGMESYRAPCERKNQSLQQLQGLLVASNCKFEAIVVVLQQTLAEHDEVIKQRRDLSQELMTLKGELVNSARSCELLEREKDEVCGALEGVLQTMQEQHHTELAQLEERLRVFYQAEWDNIHLTYQEEADRCKALMEQQMTELRASHEAVTLELEASHSEQIQAVKQQYEESLKEFRQAHERELQTLDKKLKEAGATLSIQIQELTEENTTLNHRIKAEEDQRRELAERSQKDSHTLYLEQELESLKVVLDIKNKQLHQQDHKLMQMDKLTEKSVKLDECLKKVQQENEDLKARMDRHAALSRQLSTEQAVLQDSLHKESKVNKRLSMENEELIWKLHNGDPSSPLKMSPTSPSHHSLGLQSPRSSAVFTSPIKSPRSSAVFSSPPVSPR